METASPHLPNVPAAADSIQVLEHSMTSILEEMKAGGRAAPSRISEAMSLMTSLFGHLTEVARECAAEPEFDEGASMASTSLLQPGNGDAMPGSISVGRGAGHPMKRGPEVTVSELEAKRRIDNDNFENTLLQEASMALCTQDGF